jgi:HMG box factor
MVRMFNRFYALSAVAVCTIVFTAWFLTSRRFPDIVPLAVGQFEVASIFDQRLVVFGDSWSDNANEDSQGKVWTDWLCSMVRLLLHTTCEINLTRISSPVTKKT